MRNGEVVLVLMLKVQNGSGAAKSGHLLHAWPQALKPRGIQRQVSSLSHFAGGAVGPALERA